MAAAEIQVFTTGNYTDELMGLSELTSRVDDPELRAQIIDRVNRMQLMLRPIVDSYLETHPETRDSHLSVQDLVGRGNFVD